MTDLICSSFFENSEYIIELIWEEIIDNLLELNKQNVDDNVKNALMIYCMYKLKGGK